ncbi:DUF3800 domain-containing protein [Corynebacterium sp. TAE3-ERU16]|uniref:DUF3800 domain-containing protein n=1 Tax=Corynebacterium sp. TAE3-ERU16 TaxID=2849493 RepID=UPI001C44BEC7|nr:DUF3800 domain-containing protein [Corynebacterium sp. TAE3-ERU16]MBV7292471.1 DUF3800 domain-containing protein [Corynebacterium sp. TAE3-ERU16]
MFLAYIDEIGEPGAFISKSHSKYNTSPAFGYAGFIIPADSARDFGQEFTSQKRVRFSKEYDAAEHPGRWEVKGSGLFRPDTAEEHPENLRIFDHLVNFLSGLGGSLFYYVDEKPLGTPKQTELNTVEREKLAMQETLNRIARHSDSHGKKVMVLMDSINEAERKNRVANMYAHIFSRQSYHPEMARIVEPPMHLDSRVSSNIQFADWVAAFVTRAIDFQLIEDSSYRWVCERYRYAKNKKPFTYESKVHLCGRALDDFNHSEIFELDRRVYPRVEGKTLRGECGADFFRKIKAAAERAEESKRNN